MKIVHIITRMVAGGAQQNTLACCHEQARRGHQVTLISGVETGSEGSLLDEAPQGPFQFLKLPALVREIQPASDLQALWWLWREFRANRPDLVHTHTSKAGLLGRLAARACHLPVVHTPHGHVFHSYFSSPKALLFKYLERGLARWCSDALIMLTPGELRDHLQEKIASLSQMYVVPSGVPLERFRHQPRGASPGAAPVVGYVGRLADIKGPLDLVSAFAQLPADCRLLMVGDGPQREQVEQQVDSAGMRERVTITGWQADVLPFLQKMDVLVVPSHNEGMGRVVVEAMSAGVPVVATAVGGLPDLVLDGHNGLLVPVRQPAALAEAIGKVLQSPGRGQAMGQAGRPLAESFSEEVMFSRLEKLYQKVLALTGQ